MILVVDLNWKKDSLALNEFVLPIASAISGLEECQIKHYSEVTAKQLDKCSKVILSGNALKDHATLTQAEKFSWLKDFQKPVLGVCAGMQTLSLVFGVPLVRCLQIGMTEVSTQIGNPLFSGEFKAYCLHNFSVQNSRTFTELAKNSKCIMAVKHVEKPFFGVLFHPEVRNLEILKNFALLKGDN
jgi:anthranilate/para-aminobenzoate synthase component II